MAAATNFTILATVTIVMPPGRREEILRTLGPLAQLAKDLYRCATSAILQDVENPNRLTSVQEWASQKDLERFIRSEDYRGLLAVMDLSARRPQIRFQSFTGEKGMEYVAALRGVPPEEVPLLRGD
jgi:quinol monooxygenase YgiN